MDSSIPPETDPISNDSISFSSKVLKEAGIKLGLPITVILDSINYYSQFALSPTHHFSKEAILCACVYLGTKVNEEHRRLRDVLNVILYVVEERTQITQSLSNQDYPFQDYQHSLLKYYKEIDISEYQKYRDEILQAEQHLLRILNYKFSSEIHFYYLMLLNLVEFLQCILLMPLEVSQTSWSIFNDSMMKAYQSSVTHPLKILLVGSIYLAIQFLVNHHKYKYAFYGQMPDKNEERRIQAKQWITASTDSCDENLYQTLKFNYESFITQHPNWWEKYFNVSSNDVSATGF